MDGSIRYNAFKQVTVQDEVDDSLVHGVFPANQINRIARSKGNYNMEQF